MKHSLIITSLCLVILSSNLLTKSKVDSKEYNQYLADQMLSVLQKTEVEPADRVQIARRFVLVSSIPEEVSAPPVWKTGWNVPLGYQYRYQRDARNRSDYSIYRRTYCLLGGTGSARMDY